MVALLLLLQLLFGFGLASVCFLFDVPLGGWQFWASVAFAATLGFRHSRRMGTILLLLNALMALLTCFTFTYIHCDAATCHVPMARFMEEGWNPVRNPTLEAVKARWVAYGITAEENPLIDFHAWHVIVGPKFVQVLAAQMQAGCRLFTAAGYPLWILFMALALTAYRAARELFGTSARVAAGASALFCCNPILVYGSFRGQVDFVPYAAAVIAGLSLLLWRAERRRVDLILFFAALVIAAVSKFNGLYPFFLFLAVGCWWGWRDSDFRRGLLVFALAFLVFGLLPYWTSAWWYGSPLFPLHTFRSDVVLPELTGDFDACNDAAHRMGHLARFVYAYVSPRLAVWGSRLWQGDPTFTPVWAKTWISSGFTLPGRLILWGALLVSPFVRQRGVRTILVVFFLPFFLIPTRYIGFPRYVALVHAGIVLAFFAWALACRGRVRTALFAGFRVAVLAAVGWAAFQFLGQLRVEGFVQRNLARMREAGTPYALRTDQADLPNQETWAYVLSDRSAVAGCPIVINAPGPRLEMDFQMVMSGPGLETEPHVPYFRLFPIPHPVWK